MLYTSGTTGRPKGVKREPQTPAMQQAMGEMVSIIYDLRPGEKVHLQYTTTSPLLQRRLGVAEEKDASEHNSSARTG